jgi:hypothetical protein
VVVARRLVNELLTPVGGLVALVLAWRLFPRIIELKRRRRQLVLPDFANATGDSTLDSVLAGSGIRLRERLAVELDRTRRKIETSRRYVEGRASVAELANAGVPSQDQAPLPSKSVDPRLGELLASISPAIPEHLRPVMGLVAAAFPPTGTLVGGAVQRQSEGPDRLGVSVEITELDGPPESRPWTFWESAPPAARRERLRGDVGLRRPHHGPEKPPLRARAGAAILR